MLFCISVGLALVMAVLLFRVFFSNLPDFLEYFFRPGPGTLKVVIWAALAIITGITAYFTLPRHIPQLARQREAKVTVAVTNDGEPKPGVVHARSGSKVATDSITGPPPPQEAVSRGVNLGDTVQISALQPAIALRSAIITSMDDTQLTIRANSGSYTILWKDLTGLKVATNATNKSGP